jgi:hypothetical protein
LPNGGPLPIDAGKARHLGWRCESFGHADDVGRARAKASGRGID